MANPIRMDKESLQALQGNNLSCSRDYSFLDKIDDAFVETNQLLNQAEDITGFGYISQKSRMHDIFMAYWELNTCIDTLLQEITEADNQLHKMVNDTANELERICLEDIEIPDTIHYYNSYEELPTLTINNFIQDGFVETNASVQGFVDLFDGVIIYGEDEMTLEEYVQYLEAQSVCTISYYSGEKANLNLLVTELSMGVKDLYDGIAGYDIITGEHLSKQERTFKLWWGIGMMSFNLLMPAISGLRAQQAIGQKIYKWLDDIFLMEGINPRIIGGISQELAEQTARSGIQTLSNKGLNTISRQITEESVEDAIRITAREGVETIGEHVVQEGMEDTVQITTREGIEDTIQTATRDRIEAFGQRITPEGIPTGSHPWESIYSGVKENAAILEKQVIQQEIYIPNRYDSTYGIRATEQQFTREGVETTLGTASREGIEEMQEQAMREAAEAMERGRVSSKGGKYSVFGEMSEADGVRYRDWNYEKIYEISIHNPNADSMTLGKYFDGTIESGSYIARAELTGDTYFSLGTQWNDIAQAYGLSDKEMFNLFNTRALDDAVMQGKTIRFSQNPLDWSGTALGDEWSYLQYKHGYRDLIEMEGYWYAIK
mgnify:FL=1